jgi:hypothetical protein
MSCQVPEEVGVNVLSSCLSVASNCCFVARSLSLDLCIRWKLVNFLHFYILTSQALCV